MRQAGEQHLREGSVTGDGIPDTLEDPCDASAFISKTAEEWKAKGNEEVKEGKYTAAYRSYTEGLN